MDASGPSHLRTAEIVLLLLVFLTCLLAGRWCSRLCLRNHRFALMDDVDLSRMHAKYKVRSWGDGLGDYRLVQ